MSYNIKGKVLSIGETAQISEKFKKRELIVQTASEWGNTVPISFNQDNTSKLDGIGIGSDVDVSFFVEGREWKGRYFVNLTASDIIVETVAGTTTAPIVDNGIKAPVANPRDINVTASASGDLPF